MKEKQLYGIGVELHDINSIYLDFSSNIYFFKDRVFQIITITEDIEDMKKIFEDFLFLRLKRIENGCNTSYEILDVLED